MESKITDAENKFCEFQLKMTGSFFTTLITAMMQADRPNRALLSMGYPELTEVVNRYQNENGYWESLCKKWNETHPHHQLS